jgi:hypothetical protein
MMGTRHPFGLPKARTSRPLRRAKFCQKDHPPLAPGEKMVAASSFDYPRDFGCHSLPDPRFGAPVALYVFTVTGNSTFRNFAFFGENFAKMPKLAKYPQK